MTYNEFLKCVIDDGIEACKKDYVNDKEKREGSIAGFEACRDKTPEELYEIYQEANQYAQEAYFNQNKYWWFRCYQLEVEWVCNCVSALLYNEGQQPILSWLPTVRGMSKAADIVGVDKSK